MRGMFVVAPVQGPWRVDDSARKSGERVCRVGIKLALLSVLGLERTLIGPAYTEVER